MKKDEVKYNLLAALVLIIGSAIVVSLTAYCWISHWYEEIEPMIFMTAFAVLVVSVLIWATVTMCKNIIEEVDYMEKKYTLLNVQNNSYEENIRKLNEKLKKRNKKKKEK